MHATRVLVIGSVTLSRLIGHLFDGRPEFEVVGTVSGLTDLGRQASQLVPELIVANVNPVSIGICRVVAAIMQSSPAAKVIVVCPIEELGSTARKCGADAFLRAEELSGRLVGTARSLTAHPRPANAGD